MIPLRDQEYLRARFAREMVGAVRIDHFTQRKLPIYIPGREECAFCEEIQQTLKELAALSEKIKLNVYEFSQSTAEAARLKVDKVPGTVIRGPLNRPIRFYGFPAGQEFPAFVEDIIDASRGKVELAPETVRQLRKLRREIAVQVFVTPTCPALSRRRPPGPPDGAGEPPHKRRRGGDQRVPPTGGALPGTGRPRYRDRGAGGPGGGDGRGAPCSPRSFSSRRGRPCSRPRARWGRHRPWSSDRRSAGRAG